MKAQLISGRAKLVPSEGSCKCGNTPTCGAIPQGSCDPTGDGPGGIY